MVWGCEFLLPLLMAYADAVLGVKKDTPILTLSPPPSQDPTTLSHSTLFATHLLSSFKELELEQLSQPLV